MDLQNYVEKLTAEARNSSLDLAVARSEIKNTVLSKMASNLRMCSEELKEANQKDLAEGNKNGLSDAMLDRLELTDSRIEDIAKSVDDIAELKDPVGGVIDGWVLPNGLRLTKRRVPLGVVCIIYESRPNVTADAAALCVKSGNAVILRGGKEAIHSNTAIYRQLKKAFNDTDLPPNCVQLVETTDRAAVPPLLTAEKDVDVIIPRGGKGLIKHVMETATIPVVKHYDGVCHTYVDERCNLHMALEICENAKCQRPGVCNAMETLLVHKDIADDFLPMMKDVYDKKGVELRGCPIALKVLNGINPASEDDWYEEYLDLILAVRVVNGVDEAVEHINRYGSGHSDAIVTDDLKAAETFQNAVDSATVYVNASTRFTDGGEFGLGAEIGISTNKLHARGPMALEELTTYKWLVNGEGQIR